MGEKLSKSAKPFPGGLQVQTLTGVSTLKAISTASEVITTVGRLLKKPMAASWAQHVSVGAAGEVAAAGGWASVFEVSGLLEAIPDTVGKLAGTKPWSVWSNWSCSRAREGWAWTLAAKQAPRSRSVFSSMLLMGRATSSQKLLCKPSIIIQDLAHKNMLILYWQSVKHNKHRTEQRPPCGIVSQQGALTASVESPLTPRCSTQDRANGYSRGY
jgi:hypothetical protein